MQKNHEAPERQSTVTEIARRAQIVDATIRTLAESGYAKTSYSQIARRAGLSSTGLISYHFASKGELMGEVVSAVIDSIGRHVYERMERTTSPAEALRAYILATTGYIGGHREEMATLLAVVMSGSLGTGSPTPDGRLMPSRRFSWTTSERASSGYSIRASWRA